MGDALEKLDLSKISQNILRKFRRSTEASSGYLSLEDYLVKLLEKGIDPYTGHAKVDPTSVAPPVGYKRHPTIAETVRDLIRSEKLKNALSEAGEETFEEADDFDVDDEPPLPPHLYEPNFDPEIQGGVGVSPTKTPSEPPPPAAPSEAPLTPPPPAPSPVPAPAGSAPKKS